MLRLTPELQSDLLAKPESGMGYQVVEATSSDYRTRRATAYNAELLVFDSESPLQLRQSYEHLLRVAKSAAA